MNSNWELTKARSKYHFNNFLLDPKWDSISLIGKVIPFWQYHLTDMIESSRPVSWRTRGRENDPLKRQTVEYDQEEYDLEQQGYGKDYIISNLNYNVPEVFEPLINNFCLDKVMARVHIQMPGQVWNLHLDKLEKWMPKDPTKVVRYFIHLTDWEQGHFWSYGNFMYSGWRAGEITTFDWINVPHCTANAGHNPRLTLQITGIETANTQNYLARLKTNMDK